MRLAMQLLRWSLFVTLLLAACSPASTPMPISVPTAVPSEATLTEVSQPAAIATSRGDKLEASAPASVKYGAGRPVLVEFFRFT